MNLIDRYNSGNFIIRDSKMECREIAIHGDPNPDNPLKCEGFLTEDTFEIWLKYKACSLFRNNIR